MILESITLPMNHNQKKNENLTNYSLNIGMNTKHCKPITEYAFTYIWGMLWLIAGIQHSTNLPLFKQVEILSQYIC